MKQLIYLLGKSASGKDTIYNEILRKRKDIVGIKIYSTRPKRDGESEETYNFISKDKMDNMNGVIEKRTYNTTFGSWDYATVDDGQFDNDNILLGIGTLESYISLKNYFGDGMILPVYIYADEDILFSRAITRQMDDNGNIDDDKLNEINRRFEADKIDFSDDKLKEAGILKKYNNIDVNTCVDEILNDLENKI